MLLPAITGKVEMVYEGEQQGAEVVARKIIGDAVRKAFDARFPAVGKELGSGGDDDTGPYAPIVHWFSQGNFVTLADELSFADHRAELERVPGLFALVREHAASAGATPEDEAFAAELVLEGLHQHVKLTRHDLDSTVSYKEMLEAPAPPAATPVERRRQLAATDAPPLRSSRPRTPAPAARVAGPEAPVPAARPRHLGATSKRRWSGCGTCSARVTSTRRWTWRPSSLSSKRSA